MPRGRSPELVISGGRDPSLQRVLEDAIRWALARDFRGYDPYDGLNTRHTILLRTKALRLGMVYLNKFSPFNLRPLLGIPPHPTPAGVAGVSRVLLRRGAEHHAEILARNVEFLLERSLHLRYGRHCWNGVDFPIQMVDEYQTPDVPGVVGTAACTHFLLDYYQRHRERDDLREVVRSVRDFLLDALLQEYAGLVFFRYKPTTPPHRYTYNASAIAAGLVDRCNAVLDSTRGDDAVEASIRHLARRQHEDGHWNYAVDLRTGVEKPQVDFHQGYVLDQLLAWLDRHGPDAEIEAVCARGLRFYRDEQFLESGRGLYRWPRAWPVNINNQAQGIVTFSRAARFSPEYPRFARTIAEWTVRNLYDPRGFFLYLKYPLITYRVPYLRWAQASMIEALDLLLTDDHPHQSRGARRLPEVETVRRH